MSKSSRSKSPRVESKRERARRANEALMDVVKMFHRTFGDPSKEKANKNRPV